MNLQEFNTALPKNWLSISAHDAKIGDLYAVKTLSTGASLNPAWLTYDPGVGAGINISAITNATFANVTRFGQTVTVTGSFQATVAAGVSAVTFSINTPAGASSVSADRRGAFATCNNTTASFLAMSMYDLSNISDTKILFGLRTATGANQPGAPTANVLFNYSVTFYSAI